VSLLATALFLYVGAGIVLRVVAPDQNVWAYSEAFVYATYSWVVSLIVKVIAWIVVAFCVTLILPKGMGRPIQNAIVKLTGGLLAFAIKLIVTGIKAILKKVCSIRRR
jgi:small neutral amino acid transporter SnatA (MarC family)